MDTGDMILKSSALEWLSPQSWRLEVSDLFSPEPFGGSHLTPSCPLGEWLGNTLPGIVICVYACNLGSCRHSPHPPFLLPLRLTEWTVALCNWEHQWGPLFPVSTSFLWEVVKGIMMLQHTAVFSEALDLHPFIQTYMHHRFPWRGQQPSSYKHAVMILAKSLCF